MTKVKLEAWKTKVEPVEGMKDPGESKVWRAQVQPEWSQGIKEFKVVSWAQKAEVEPKGRNSEPTTPKTTVDLGEQGTVVTPVELEG